MRPLSGTLRPVTDHVAPVPARGAGGVAAFVVPGSPRLQQLAAVVAALVFFTALFVLCRAMDQREDRGRPMYRDVLTMAWIQYDRLREGGQVLPADLRTGDRLTVDGAWPVMSVGVRLRVVQDHHGFCVRGWNQYGETTAWVCGDASTKPPALGALAHLD